MPCEECEANTVESEYERIAARDAKLLEALGYERARDRFTSFTLWIRKQT